MARAITGSTVTPGRPPPDKSSELVPTVNMASGSPGSLSPDETELMLTPSLRANGSGLGSALPANFDVFGVDSGHGRN